MSDQPQSPTPAPTPRPANPPKPRRRHPVLRFLFKSLLTLGVLAGMLMIGVEVVLHTDVPRSLIIQQVQKQFGLRFAAASVSTGWLGHTTLREVTVSLPLDDQSFLQAPTLEVDHTNLAWLLITQDLQIHAVRLDKPVLVVRQNTAGRWNLQELVTLVARTAGSQQAQEQTRKKSAPTLPGVQVDAATVKITDNRGRTNTISPVNVAGEKRGPLVWTYAVTAPPQLDLKGELAVGGDWQQRLTLSLSNLKPWLQPWIDNWPDDAFVKDLTWEGHIPAAGQLSGRLDADRIQYSTYGVSGTARLTYENGTATLTPQPMTLHTALRPLGQLLVRDGKLQVTRDAATADALVVSMADGLLKLDGQYSWRQDSADLSARWDDVRLPLGASTAGSLTGTLRSPWPGQPRVDATLTTEGRTTYGEWDSTFQITGEGKGYDNIAWTVRAPELAFQADGTRSMVKTSEFVAHLTSRGNALSLNDMHVTAPGRVTGRGAYNFADHQWWLWMSAENWHIPRTANQTAALNFSLWGNSQWIHLEDFYLRGGQVQLGANGWWGFDWPKPIQAYVQVTHPPLGALPAGEDRPLRGKINASAEIGGTVTPLKLDLAGDFTGRNIIIARHPVGDTNSKLTGQITRDDTRVHTDLHLLDGDWALDATYPVHSPSLDSRAFRIAIDAKHVSVEQIGELVERHGFAGAVDGHWALDVAGARLDQLAVTGELSGSDLKLGPVAAHTLTANTSIDEGVLSVNHIAVQQTEAQGRAQADISVGLHDLRHVQLTLSAAAWQIDFPRAHTSLRVTGGTDGELLVGLDPQHRSADGQVSLSSDVIVNGQPLGSAQIQTVFRQRRDEKSGSLQQIVRIDKFQADALGGSLSGTAGVNVDQPRDVNGLVNFSGVQLEKVADLLTAFRPENPYFAGLSGKVSGGIVIEPAVSHGNLPPLEPVALRVTITSDGAHWRTVTLGDTELYAYFDARRQDDMLTWRLVSGDGQQRSVIHLADGAVYPWLRLTKYMPRDLPSVREAPLHPLYFTQIIADLERLDANQVVHALEPKADPMPARVSGQLTVMGSVRDLNRLKGNGSITITDSDLVGFDPVGALVARLGGQAAPQPIGHGSLEAHLEASRLSLINIRYANEGTFIRGAMDLENLWKGPDSPIQGTLVGTVRPLNQIKLPLIADADKILGVLQENFTAVDVTGALREPKVEQTTLKDVGDAIRRFILGDVKNETRGSSGR